MYVYIYIQLVLNALPLSCDHDLFPFHEWNNWSNSIHLLLYDSSIGRWVEITYSSYRNKLQIGSIFICIYIYIYIYVCMLIEIV